MLYCLRFDIIEIIGAIKEIWIFITLADTTQ